MIQLISFYFVLLFLHLFWAMLPFLEEHINNARYS